MGGGEGEGEEEEGGVEVIGGERHSFIRVIILFSSSGGEREEMRWWS